jgi:hypothetical protein
MAVPGLDPGIDPAIQADAGAFGGNTATTDVFVEVPGWMAGS